jgi:hypothetical protein
MEVARRCDKVASCDEVHLIQLIDRIGADPKKAAGQFLGDIPITLNRAP